MSPHILCLSISLPLSKLRKMFRPSVTCTYEQHGTLVEENEADGSEAVCMASLVAMPQEQADGAADASLIRKAIEYCIGEDIAQELQSGKVPRCVSINFSPQNKKLWQRLAGKSKRKRKKTNANAGEKSQKPQRPQRQPGKITLYDTGLAHTANFCAPPGL